LVVNDPDRTSANVTVWAGGGIERTSASSLFFFCGSTGRPARLLPVFKQAVS
jgi:hypothetical protein